MITTNYRWRGACIAALAGLSFAAVGDSDETDTQEGFGFWGSPRSADEVAIELLNPAGSLFSIANDFLHRPMQGNLPGGNDQTSLVYTVAAVWPFILNNGKTLSLRAELPINLDQPTYLTDEVESNEYIEWRIRQDADVISREGTFFDIHDHAYDVSLNVTYGGVSDSGFISMYGAVVVLPSSQDGSVERDAYMIGPEVSLGKLTDWGIYGVTANHPIKVGEASELAALYDHNLTTFKLFFAYGLGNGWHLISNPVIEYDWEAASDNKLLLPIGGGVSKTFKIGKIPVKMELEFQHYLETPESFGPDWTLRFGITPVLSDRALP